MILASSSNGWLNDDLTAEWLKTVVGNLSFRKRILVWDSYRCHISEKTKEELRKGYNINTEVIPGGCTKYIQAPDVSWYKPFKQHLGELYDDWLATDDNKEFTKGGNLKAPSLKLLIDWVKAAWALLSADLIKRSFKACALTNATDGSEDDQITCFEQDCPAGRELLTTKAAEMVSVTAEPETTANAGELAASEIPELELNMEVDEIYKDHQNDYGIDSSDDDDE